MKKKACHIIHEPCFFLPHHICVPDHPHHSILHYSVAIQSPALPLTACRISSRVNSSYSIRTNFAGGPVFGHGWINGSYLGHFTECGSLDDGILRARTRSVTIFTKVAKGPSRRVCVVGMTCIVSGKHEFEIANYPLPAIRYRSRHHTKLAGLVIGYGIARGLVSSG